MGLGCRYFGALKCGYEEEQKRSAGLIVTNKEVLRTLKEDRQILSSI